MFTTEVLDTGAGYLSHTYTSQYSDPASGETRGGRSSFTDTFIPLPGGGPWVLAERVVVSEGDGTTAQDGSAEGRQIFRFEDLAPLS